MATAAERKALIFLAAVACLGLGARLARGRGDAALLGAGRSGATRDALDTQIEAAAAARANGAGGRSRRGNAASGRGGARGRSRRASADSLDGSDSVALRAGLGESPPAAPRRRTRRSAPDSAAAEQADGWAGRPVVTTLDAGGFGTVRAGTPAPDPDTTAPSKPKRRRRAKSKP